MFRKKDVVVIASVLLLALAAYGATLLFRGGQQVSGVVEVYAEGVLYTSAPLSVDQVIAVQQANGEVNEVQIEDGVVSMRYSSCKNQLCVHQGAMSADNWTRRALGRSIICLPNQVLVSLALEEDHPTMQDPNAPDM